MLLFVKKSKVILCLTTKFHHYSEIESRAIFI